MATVYAEAEIIGFACPICGQEHPPTAFVRDWRGVLVGPECADKRPPGAPRGLAKGGLKPPVIPEKMRIVVSTTDSIFPLEKVSGDL